MRYAILGDIHANLGALEAVLGDLALAQIGGGIAAVSSCFGVGAHLGGQAGAVGGGESGLTERAGAEAVIGSPRPSAGG